MSTKGYKAFDSNLRCRDFQFEVGQTYNLNGELKICNHGFHFCLKLNDVFNYYTTSYDTRVCEIEALSEVQSEENKSCALNIKILRELSKEEIKALTDDLKFNSGHSNSGHYNSGHYNSGKYNSGNYNSGHSNSGHYNSGHSNSGHYNSGHSNSGNSNSGHYNSGHYNSGKYNSGNYNSGDYNSGYFNTKTPKVRLFNQNTDLDWNSEIIRRLNNLTIKPILQWVYECSMTEEEKKNYPSYKTTGGYLKNTGKQDWSSLSDNDKEFIQSLPGYDDEIFKEITGISLIKSKKKGEINHETK